MIILLFKQLRTKIIDIIGYEELHKSNYRILDVSTIFNKYDTEIEFVDSLKTIDKHIVCDDLLKLEKFISENSAEHYILIHEGVLKKHEVVLKIFKKLDVQYSYKYTKRYPRSINANLRGKLKLSLYLPIQLIFKRLVGSFFNRGLQKPRFIFLGTKGQLGFIQFIGIKTKIKFIHSDDYDNYLRNRNKLITANSKDNKERYIVYIDQYLPFHEELIERNIPRPDPELFYNEVKVFLELLCEVTGSNDYKVACHPTSDKRKISTYINSDKIYKGNTERLVKDSFLTVNHYSKALNFSVIHNKPVVFFLPDSIQNNDHFRKHTNILCKKLNSKPMNINDLYKYSLADSNGFLKRNNYNRKFYLKYFLSENPENEELNWRKIYSLLQNSFT